MLNARLTGFTLVALQALVLWHTTSSPFVPMLAMALACAALVVAGRAKMSLYAWQAIVAAAVGAIAVKQIVAPLPSDAIAAQRYDLWPLLLAETLLLVQVAALAADGTARPRRWPAVLALATLVCLFHQSPPPTSETPLLAAAIGAMLLIAWQFANWERDDRLPAAQHRWLCVALLAASAALAWLFVPAWKFARARLEGQSPAWAATASGHSALGRYVDTGSLAAVTQAQLADPQRMALIVHCDRAPGYLRGRVFDTYSHAQWIAPRSPREPDGTLPPAVRTELPLAGGAALAANEFRKQNLFILGTSGARSSAGMTPMTIQNEPTRGKVYFLPLGTALVQGAGGAIDVDEHDVVLAGLSTNDHYTAFRPTRPTSPPPATALAARLREPLVGLDPRVATLAQRVGGGRRTTREKIAAVEAYFRSGYTYSTRPMRIPAGVDPLSHFLLARPPAHCEFFASGAAALLREVGVPCRYVTGYVVIELEDEYGEYWLARNRNAHAWVEAYDAERRQWAIVEATPGIDVPDDADAEAELAARGETASAATSYNVSSWNWSWSALARRLEWLPLAALGLMLTASVVLVRRAPSRGGLTRKLRRLDRIARRRGLRRRNNETLHQFARRVAAHAPGDEQLAACAAEYQQYAHERYRPAPAALGR